MRFLDLCDREVINAKDCKCLGYIKDLEIDVNCGQICAVVIPGPGRYFGCFGKDYEFTIPWVKIIRIGPDIVLVDLDEREVRRKLQGKFTRFIDKENQERYTILCV